MFEMTPFDRRRRHAAVYNPFREFENLERSFFGDHAFSEFRTDIEDKGDSYVLEAELPGFEKDEIHVDIDDNYLTISAERRSECEEKDKKGNYIRCERSYGSLSRSFDVSNVKTEEIHAAYKNGVLRLTMPKKEETPPSSRRLEIE